MYKMVVEITKETQEKCGIKTVKHYNEENHLIELWQKMSDIEIQLEHSSIADIVLKRIREHCSKKKKHYKRRKRKRKHFLKVKRVFLLLKNLHVI